MEESTERSGVTPAQHCCLFPRVQDDTTQFWFHYKYLEERENPYWKGLVGWYTVKVANSDDSVKVARQIDETFSNSP
jgi:hypothetical protein